MKYLTLILLAFTASADQTIELNGDLNLVGTSQTAATEITYNLEGNTVELCLGISLNGTSPPDGGGGGASLDESTRTPSPANSEVTVTDGYIANKLVAGATGGVFGTSTRDDGGFYYMEYKFLTSVTFDAARVGVSWNNAAEFDLTSSLSFEFRRGYMYLGGAYQSVVSTWGNLGSGDIFRIWIKGNKVFVGARKSGVDYVVGDPVAGTGEVYTISPTNPLRGLLFLSKVNDYAYLAKTSDIEVDALGATPFED